MKKLMTIFFDRGQMKAFESIKEPEKVIVKTEFNIQIRKGGGKEWAHYYYELEAACDAALPVADESKEKVQGLIFEQMTDQLFRELAYKSMNEEFVELDQTKSYNVECEMREEIRPNEDFDPRHESELDKKVLVLLVESIHEAYLRDGHNPGTL